MKKHIRLEVATGIPEIAIIPIPTYLNSYGRVDRCEALWSSHGSKSRQIDTPQRIQALPGVKNTINDSNEGAYC